jgi:hypothetical protein
MAMVFSWRKFVWNTRLQADAIVRHKQIDTCNIMKHFAKFKATAAKDIHIRPTITSDCLLEIEHIIVLFQLLMPFFSSGLIPSGL